MDIYLFNDDLEQVGLIDSSESYFVTLNYSKVGEFQFKVKLPNSCVELLKRDIKVRFGKDERKSGYIDKILFQRDNKGVMNVLVSGCTLGQELNNYIIYPNGQTDQIKAHVEEVMKHYVRNNTINANDSKRNIPYLVCSEDKHLGKGIKWESRLLNLKDEIETISAQYKLGWKIDLDIKEKQMIFDVYEGVKRPIVLSPENENIYIESYTDINRRERNFAYVEGEGKDDNKRIYEIDQTNQQKRKEIYFVGKDSDNEYIDIHEQSERALMEYNSTRTIEGHLLDVIDYKYDRDYFLGDIVSIKDSEIGLLSDMRLDSVTISYDKNDGEKTYATLIEEEKE